MDRNVRLLVSYDGGDFHGWQVQPGQRTVQGVLEESLRRVFRHPVTLIASGRTDAGVHAAGQVANVRTTCTLACDKLLHAIGSRLPSDVAIRDVRDVAGNFHATRCALRKLYRYRIHNDRCRSVPKHMQRYAFHYWEPLDLNAMREAAKAFVGTMDFTAMTTSRCQRASMVRTVHRCDVVRHLDELRVDVSGSGFLYNQVRNMVGTLIEVGRGHWSADRVGDILESKNRSDAGPTSPAHGLCLQWVEYPAHLLRLGGRPEDCSPSSAPATES